MPTPSAFLYQPFAATHAFWHHKVGPAFAKQGFFDERLLVPCGEDTQSRYWPHVPVKMMKMLSQITYHFLKSSELLFGDLG